MKRQLTAEECDTVLRDIYADVSPHMRAKYGSPPAQCLGVDLSDLRKQFHEDTCREAREESIQRNYKPNGCGRRIVIGWASLSVARCGAELNSFGKVSLLKCPECGGDGSCWLE